MGWERNPKNISISPVPCPPAVRPFPNLEDEGGAGTKIREGKKRGGRMKLFFPGWGRPPPADCFPNPFLSSFSKKTFSVFFGGKGETSAPIPFLAAAAKSTFLSVSFLSFETGPASNLCPQKTKEIYNLGWIFFPRKRRVISNRILHRENELFCLSPWINRGSSIRQTKYFFPWHRGVEKPW